MRNCIYLAMFLHEKWKEYLHPFNNFRKLKKYLLINDVCYFSKFFKVFKFG